MQIFKVISNGEVHEIIEDQPIKELMQSSESYILCDDDTRIVYLWKGSECSVRSKFIGANKLQEVRGQVGLNYKSISMDEDEANDYPEFIEAIQNPRKDGFAQEIKEDMELQFELGGGPTAPKTYRDVMKNQDFNEQIEQSGPLYTGDGGSSASSSSYSSSPAKEYSKDELDKIIESLDEQGIPDGFEREMVIMGDKAYSVAEKVQTFLGNKQVERVLEPISSLPEGVFFAEGYVPRVLVEGQTIVAIEFLKKKE